MKVKKVFNKVFQMPLLFALLVMAAFVITSNLMYTVLSPIENALLYYCLRGAVEIGLAIGAALLLKKKLGRGFTLGVTGKRLGKAFLLLGSFYLSLFFNGMQILSALNVMPADTTGGQILHAVLTGTTSGMRPGIVEELICRVCIMGYLAWMWAEKPDGLRKAVWVSAVIFGLAHMNNVADNGLLPTLLQCMYSMAIGALFGAVYARTHNLLSLMAVHVAVDSMAFIAADLPVVEEMAEALEAAESAPNAASMIVYLVISLIWAGTAAFLLRKEKLGEAELLWKPEALPAAE